uniref:SnoaL-like domain-containing protein n=1 Tax=Talaromyces marneffei PM1 TaxID=1077442 RepID=A0A093XIU0_TALMA
MATQDHHAEAIAWLEDFHKHMDAMDPNLAIPKFYTDDCVLRFAKNPAISGKSSIIDFFNSQFPHLESMKHTIKHVDVLPDRIYQEADIRKLGDEKMSFFTVYLDPTELKERIMAVAEGLI